MKDGLLLLCLLAAFYLGHFPMKRLDRFLQRNSESIERGAGRSAAAAPRAPGAVGKINTFVVY